VLGSNSDIKVLLYTDEAIWMYMNDDARCNTAIDSVCQQFREFGGHRLFDIVKFYDHLVLPTLTDSKPFFRGFQTLWRLKRIVGELHSPFDTTMFLDSDVHVCPGFERMFDTYLDDHHLFAATIASNPFGKTNGSRVPLRAGIPAAEFAQFPERNMGFVVLKSDHPKVMELMTLYRDTFVRHVSDPNVMILGDQASMREALFTMRVWVHDHVVSSSIGCRFVGGCDDGCLIVHRHWDRDKSGSDVRSPAQALAHQ
jgi:hypothetical protein